MSYVTAILALLAGARILKCLLSSGASEPDSEQDRVIGQYLLGSGASEPDRVRTTLPKKPISGSISTVTK